MIRRTLILLFVFAAICIAARWRQQWLAAGQPRGSIFEQRLSEHSPQRPPSRCIGHTNLFKRLEPPLAQPTAGAEPGWARPEAQETALDRLARQIELWRKDDPLNQQERLTYLEADMGEVDGDLKRLNDEIARLEAGTFRGRAGAMVDRPGPEVRAQLAKLKESRDLCQDQLTQLIARRQHILQLQR